AERLHGIDAGSSMRRNVASQQRRNDEETRHDAKGGRVDRTDVEEERMHAPADKIGTDEAENEANGSEDDSLAQDKANDSTHACTQRHAQADFVRALRDGEGHHTVDAESGEQKRNTSEAAEKKSREPVARHRFLDDLIHRFHAGEGQIR